MLELDNDNPIDENKLGEFNQFLNVIVPYLSNNIQILLAFSEVNKHAYKTIREHLKKPEVSLAIIQQLKDDFTKQRQYLNYYREVINSEFNKRLTKEAFKELTNTGKMLYILSTNDISNLGDLECKAFSEVNYPDIAPDLIKNINLTLAVSEQNSVNDLESTKDYFTKENRSSKFCLNLQGADLQDALLDDVNLQSADLQGADLQNVLLWGANLSYAKLQGANLQSADLWSATLQGADFQDTNLHSARLQDAKLQGAKLQNAKLHDVNFINVNLQGANLPGAELYGANFQFAKLSDCCIRLATGLDSLFATAPATELSKLTFFTAEDFNNADSLNEVLSEYKKNSDNEAIFSDDTKNKVKPAIRHAMANALIRQVKDVKINNDEDCIALFETALKHPFFNQQENSAAFFSNNETNLMIGSQNIIKEAIEELKKDCQNHPKPITPGNPAPRLQ